MSCFTNRGFPDCRKLCKVTPILKQGDPTCSNYKFIMITTIFFKNYRSHIKRIIVSLQNLKILSERQYGFGSLCSTTQTVIEIVYLVQCHADSCCEVNILENCLKTKMVRDRKINKNRETQVERGMANALKQD